MAYHHLSITHGSQFGVTGKRQLKNKYEVAFWYVIVKNFQVNQTVDAVVTRLE
jgi:hypothetical protein